MIIGKIIRLAMLAACLVCIFVSLAAAADPDGLIPKRRKDQFQKSFGYAVFPYPYILPGIGYGIGLVGGAMNIDDTYTDAYGFVFTGQVKGAALGVADVHIIPKTLILDAGYGTVSAATIQSYSARGMINTDKNDYRLIELGDMEYYGARLTASFFDRRFEFYGARYWGASELKSIRDKDGTVIIEAENPPTERGYTTLIGTRLDLTDDYSDPRRGIRFDISRSASPPRGFGPDYYVMDYNTTAYIPIGRRSTWAFNFLRSDAVVLREGVTDEQRLQNDLGINCSAISDPTESAQCEQVIHSMALGNKYGTATTLGGFSRLRAYPQGRYRGAHTEFYGTEIRWNLSDEPIPYDIFIMKDVRTALQIAAFYEIGSTADASGDLWKAWRDAYGLGLRIITASGVVFRGDVGYGREGFSPAIFIGYPWEI